MTDAPREDLAEVHRLALKRAREITMDMAERLHAHSYEPDVDLREVATTIAKVVRAVRFTIALEARLADDARRRAEADQRAAEDADTWTIGMIQNPPWPVKMQISVAQGLQQTAERKLEGLSLIRRAISKAPESEQERYEERLYASQEPNHYVRFAVASTAAKAITAVCRDIGLDPDWAAFSDLDWRLASPETRAELTGAPPPPPRADPEPPLTFAAPPSSHEPEPAEPRRATGPPGAWMG